MLIPPDSEPDNPEQEDYLRQISRELSSMEYTEFRKNWFYYQQCQLDVDGIFKKIKLMMRGATRLVIASEQEGLPGYLILFAPPTFVSQCQF